MKNKNLRKDRCQLEHEEDSNKNMFTILELCYDTIL